MPGRSGNTSAVIARWALPIATVAFFAATVSGYGVFRDELYYFACGRHLDWGYVDQPPLIALIAAAVRAVAGPSWIAARVLVAVAAGWTVLLVGDTAVAMGGGRWARLLAQLLTASAPIYMGLFSIFSMNAFDILVWAGLALIATRALRGGDPKLWLAFGVLAGVGLENKIDVGLLGAGLAAGLVLGRRFDILRDRRLWLGGAIALALFVPHLVWQQLHGWPTREFVHNAQSGKITVLGPLDFVASQFRMGGPIGFAFALAGMAWLLVADAARPFRPLGWAALAVLAFLALSIAKPYYFAPALTLLFPAAAVALETWTTRRFTRALRAAAVVAVAATFVLAPLVKPLLHEDDYVRYARRMGLAPGSDENHRLGRLPQFFADMHGWREMAQAVAAVAASLPPRGSSSRLRLRAELWRGRGDRLLPG